VTSRTLFANDQKLNDPELAIRRINDYLGQANYARVMRGLRRAVGLGPHDKFVLVRGGGLRVKTKLGEFPFQALADGHRISANLLLDLYAIALAADQLSDEGDIEGIFLIDELEQHLHPALQNGIFRRLQKLLPRMQIFATTHSPMVALGVPAVDLVVLKGKGKHVDAVRNVPDVEGYSAEDMLVDSRLFNAGAYAPETESKLQRYEALSAISKNYRTTAQRKELQQLAGQLQAQQIPEVTPDAFSAVIKKLEQKFGL
jgi:predicted ATP-binding protein involved in virulence